MKRGTEALIKFKKLQAALGLELWEVKGLLQSIWDFTSLNTPAGDIGRYTDDEIALGIGWVRRGAPELVRALVETRWIDAHSAHRLIIHDWPEHCEHTVHNTLARKGQRFANGEVPKLTRLSQQEREAAVERLQTHGKRTASVRKRPPRAPTGPEPEPDPSLAKPSQNPGSGPGVSGARNRTTQSSIFAALSTDDLRDTAVLLDWQAEAARRKQPVIGASEADRLHVLAAAERALEVGKKPVALFATLVGRAQWDKLSAAQEDRARKRFADHMRHTPTEFASGALRTTRPR